MARTDCSLTNPSPVCKDAVASYCIAIASLVNTPGNKDVAISRAKNWIASNACDELKQWFEEVENNVSESFYPHPGFIKIAWTHAFRHLIAGTRFEEAIQEILAGGGDTDTNACIVGGLLGALWGEAGIPDHMKHPVLECDTHCGRVRPDFVSTRQIPKLAEQLLNLEVDTK